MTDCRSWLVGASTSFFGGERLPDKELMDEYVASGLKCMELSYRREVYYDKIDFVHNAEKIGEYADKIGLELWSLHLPFGGGIEISNPDPSKRELAMTIYPELMEAARRAGIKVIVTHPCKEPIPDEDRMAHLKTARESLRILSEKAANLGLRLAVEDLPRSCLANSSSEMLFLLDGNPLLNTCFDLNHLLIESNIDFIRAVGSRIITLHVSDFDYIDECHLLPLEGKTDWTSIFRELEKVGYNGRFMYEVYGRGKHTLSELPENKKTLDRLYQDKKQWLTLG